MSHILTRNDFIDDARKIGCSIAAIRAVAEVESAGVGFDSKGQPKTLFEGHLFYRYTKGKFAATHPSLCYKTWTKVHYGKTRALEWARLQQALTLDRKAALLSTSWGTFQILGSNFAKCGYTDVETFVGDMFTDANTHLSMFTEFVLDSRLDDELRDLRFADFARIYNGPAYKSNAYDTKMLAAYKKYQREEDSLAAVPQEPPPEDIFWQPLEEPQPGSFAELSSGEVDIIV